MSDTMEYKHNTKQNNDEQVAFPMSLRDYFAGQTLVGLTADNLCELTRIEMAEWCYSMADMMLEIREQKEVK